MAFFTACHKDPAVSDGDKDTDVGTDSGSGIRKSYVNPISSQSLPDPTVIRGEDGKFYLYATEDIRNIPIMTSNNLMTWIQSGTVFTESTRPGIVKGEMLWAPDIAKVDGKYVLYYSFVPSDFTDPASQYNWGIGAAVADKPSGPWVGKGKVFNGEDVGVRCSIDPFFYEDGGKNYMVWGSYNGLWAIELSDDGLSIKDGAQKTRLVGLDGYGIEGSVIHKKDGYYYFFASQGGSGYYDDYKVGVVRSENLLGPYYNKEGQNATTGASLTMILKSSYDFQSPGHCSGIVTDDEGTDWLLYHAYVKGSPDGGRRLMLDKITWGADGWPVINKGKGPIKSSTEVPQFN